MDYETRSSLYNLLRQLEDSLRERPENLKVTVDFGGWHDGDRRLRLSEAGKQARYLAHRLQGTPMEVPLARSRITMDLGHIIHEYLQTSLAHADKEWEIIAVEKEVTTEIAGEEVVGHLDLILKDKESGATFLLDIKGINTYSFCELDPRRTATENLNSKGNPNHPLFWRGGDYVFDAHAFVGDTFKEKYLHQIEAYLQALEGEGQHVDACLFLLVNRDTGHIAVGLWEPTGQERLKYRTERDEQFSKALRDPNPSNHDTCNPAVVGGKLETGCSYCGFKHACFTLDVSTFRGEPTFKIKEIK